MRNTMQLKNIEKNMLGMKKVRNKSLECSDSKVTFYHLDKKSQSAHLIDSYNYLKSEYDCFFTDGDRDFLDNYDFKKFIKEFNTLPISYDAKIQILDEALQYGIEFGY